MATASLPQDPDLDQLRNQARELQRAVRAGDETARARVARWHPEPPPPDGFQLTSAQLVLAREHGFASWARLRRYVQIVTARSWTPGRPAAADEPNIPDKHHQATPLDWARYFGQPALVDLLEPVTQPS